MSDVPQPFTDELYAIPGNRVALKYLVEELNRAPITIFAREGVSAPSGYPAWKDFLVRTGATAGVDVKNISSEFEAADRIVQSAGAIFLSDSIEETYALGTPSPWEWRGALRMLPFLSDQVVTTNRNKAIEEMYFFTGNMVRVLTWEDVPHTPFWPFGPGVWKLNGTVQAPHTLMVVTSDLQKPDQQSPRRREELDNLLHSLAEENVLLFMGGWPLPIGSAHAWPPPKSRVGSHYAVLTGPPNPSNGMELMKLSIRPIWCPDFDGDGEELLIRHLRDLAPHGKFPRPPMPPPPYEPRPKPVPAPPEVEVALDAGPAAQTPPAPPPPLQVPDVPPELVQSCLAGECVLFAGAGLSARSGVSTWAQLLEAQLTFAKENGILTTERYSDLDAALNEGERNATADELVRAFGSRRDLLQDFLRQSFPEGTPLSPAHEWLRQIPFASIVTTNYDRLLETAFPEYAQAGIFTPRSPKDAEALLDALSQKRRFLLKLYGLIEQPESLLIAPFEYRETISSNVPFGKFMEGLFFSRTFFFVGLSLDGIQDFLSGFVFHGTSPRKHFALVPVSGAAWRTRASFLENRYNIQVIPLPLAEPFPEVDAFLERLSHAARPVPAAPGGAPKSGPTPARSTGIRRLILENIGPFPTLDIEFPNDKNWKILLGDNGVGKSTILKAIAAAIMGSDARSYASRLVRAGSTLGRITLITEQNPSGYITEILTTDMTGVAEVVSRPGRPMEAEGWLALGFSPLRIVTWNPSSGPQSMVQKGRPTADDLVPLLSGEADPRMDRLKQWIVNLDAAAKNSGDHSIRGAETIAAFFQLLRDLTDRKDIDFASVDANFRVLVKIADIASGVPIEVLSQGLTSLFGWIGVLCQRLKETQQDANQAALPTDAFALVLIDELDAHMHPRWQQVLVNRLKDCFPNVQFIACTHSPLIVGGLDKSEVERFTITDGAIARVDFDPDMTLGRFDQILTGELFGLASTLDATTENLIAEYRKLLGKSHRSEPEQQRYLELARDLEKRIPPSPSNLVERRARELLEVMRSMEVKTDGTGLSEEVRERMAQLRKTLRKEAAQ